MKTSELTGSLLDYWVAAAIGHIPKMVGHGCEIDDWNRLGTLVNGFRFQPSTDWNHGGPIIERERLIIKPYGDGTYGADYEFDYDAPGCFYPHTAQEGPTVLVAAMRAVVCRAFGSDVQDDVNGDDTIVREFKRAKQADATTPDKPRSIGEEFLEVLIRLLELSKLHARLAPLPIPRDKYVDKFARDFRTVRYSLGQRSGRSTAIRKLASNEDVIFIIGDAAAWKAFYDIGANVFSAASLPRVIAKNRRWPRIWVEEWDMMPEEFRANIYKLAQDADQQFILL
jgi:hypothetical protein